MIIALALGVTSLVVLPPAGLAWLVVRAYRFRQGRRLDRTVDLEDA